MQDGGRAEGEPGGVLLQVAADGAEGAVGTVPDGDDEVGPAEDHDLAGLDDLGAAGAGGDVADGLHDDEVDVVVAFQLGALVGVDGVLDGERVQAEDLGEVGQFGGGRLVQADPDEAGAVALGVSRPSRMRRTASATVSVETRCPSM